MGKARGILSWGTTRGVSLVSLGKPFSQGLKCIPSLDSEGSKGVLGKNPLGFGGGMILGVSLVSLCNPFS